MDKVEDIVGRAPITSEERLAKGLSGHTVEQMASKILRRYQGDVPEIKQYLREGEDVVLVAHIQSQQALIEEMREALTAAKPHLEDNARFLRSMQAHSGKIIDAYRVSELVSKSLSQKE